MPGIGIIRCERNQDKCPMANCFKCLREGREGFAGYGEPCVLVGVMTCRCPGGKAADFAGILKKKGAEIVHFCTCAGAGKEDGTWRAGRGFCENPETLIKSVAVKAGIPCVLGTAHLPARGEPKRFAP